MLLTTIPRRRALRRVAPRNSGRPCIRPGPVSCHPLSWTPRTPCSGTTYRWPGRWSNCTHRIPPTRPAPRRPRRSVSPVPSSAGGGRTRPGSTGSPGLRSPLNSAVSPAGFSVLDQCPDHRPSATRTPDPAPTRHGRGQRVPLGERRRPARGTAPREVEGDVPTTDTDQRRRDGDPVWAVPEDTAVTRGPADDFACRA